MSVSGRTAIVTGAGTGIGRATAQLLAARGAKVVAAGVRAGTTELWPLTRAVDAAVGPFPAFTHELAASVRAHLAEA